VYIVIPISIRTLHEFYVVELFALYYAVLGLITQLSVRLSSPVPN